MFNCTPLAGAKSHSTASQSLLELDGGIKILVDVGWDETFSLANIRAIEDVTPTLSFILLTHPTLDHLGAYAHCCKHIPHFNNIPVYATRPVIALGRTLLLDLYASTPLAATIIPSASLLEATYSSTFATDGSSPNVLLQPPNAEEITSYFNLIESLEYSQPHQPLFAPFTPQVDGMTITAFNAGHTPGGSLWHIQYGLETIVVALDWNLAKENILSGAEWLGAGSEVIEQLRRPTALVCSSKGAERQQASGGRKKRDDTLLALVHETVMNGGTVLIPTDSSARVLELAYILEQHWRAEVNGAQREMYKQCRLTLASRTAGSTLRLARSMVTWMDEGIRRAGAMAHDRDAGDGNGQGPFDFKHVKTVERKSQLERMLSGNKPAVILASDKSLEFGFSADVLHSLCGDSKNLIILTEPPTVLQGRGDGQTAVSHKLWSQWESWAQKRDMTDMRDLTCRVSGLSVPWRNVSAARLEGEEITYYQQYLARQRRLRGTDDEQDTLAKDMTVDAAESESSSSSESGDDHEEATHQGRALNITASMTHVKRRVNDADLGVNVLIRSKNVFDYDVRGKQRRDKMFPFVVKRTKADDFGEIIGPADYLRAEERDDTGEAQDNATGPTASDGPMIGQKRKWGDVATKQGQVRDASHMANKRSRGNGPNSIAATGNGTEGANDDTDMDAQSEESDYEPEEAVPEGPLKALISEENVDFHMGIAHVDFSAVHEKRDLHMLIPLIRPRKLILVGGQRGETETLARDCRTLLGSGVEGESTLVLTPSMHECVDASVDTNAWTLKLTRDLVKRLAWQSVKGLGIVAVTGQLGVVQVPTVDGDNATSAQAESLRRKKLKIQDGSAAKGVAEDADDGEQQVGDAAAMIRKTTTSEAVLDVVAATSALGTTSVSTTQPIHVGDLRLADLRRFMQATGLKAEFRGQGTLLIDDSVIVRKDASGGIQVEGTPLAALHGAAAADMQRMRAGGQQEATFFTVRRRIYEGLAVVAGG